MILILKLIVYLADPVDLDVDAAVDVSIRDALGSLIQLLKAFVFQLLARSLLCHPFQHSLDIGSSGIIVLPLIVGIILDFSANRDRYGLGLVERNTAAFFRNSFLFRRTGTGTLDAIADAIRGTGRIIRISLGRILFAPRPILIFFRVTRLI